MKGLLYPGFLLGMADGKHLQETGGQNASEISFLCSSSKGLCPYQEAFPTQPTHLQEYLPFPVASGLGMGIMATFIIPEGIHCPFWSPFTMFTLS